LELEKVGDHLAPLCEKIIITYIAKEEGNILGKIRQSKA
jgi:hypothetical protein